MVGLDDGINDGIDDGCDDGCTYDGSDDNNNNYNIIILIPILIPLVFDIYIILTITSVEPSRPSCNIITTTITIFMSQPLRQPCRLHEWL